MSLEQDAAARGVKPARLGLRTWLGVLGRTLRAVDRAHVPLMAAGVAFFGLLAAIPGVAALIALVGVVGEPAWVRDQIETLSGLAPDAAIAIIDAEVRRLLAAQDDLLLFGALFNLGLSLWSALQGTRWVLMALNAVTPGPERRGLVGDFVAAGAVTLSTLALGVFAVVVMAVAPVILAAAPVSSWAETAVLFLRWPVLGGAAVAAALILYRWGPSRKPPPWRWQWPGALLAPVVWIVASAVLTFLLREFPAFGAAYGSLATVVALLLWFYITAFVFLLGGALSAELEALAIGGGAPRPHPNASPSRERG